MVLSVLMNAGPWLPVPPDGYGGIENVVATLVPPLRARGVRVVLAAPADSTLEVDELLATTEHGRFASLAAPYPQVVGIAHAHMAQVVARLRRGDIDLVHDHVEVVGPGVLGALGDDAPPVLQTLHWDLRKHPEFYGSFDGRGRVRFVGVSASQLTHAPENLRAQALGSIPLGAPLDAIPFSACKDGPLLVLGRLAAIKGPDIAARLCRARGLPVELAGPVAGLPDAAAVERALADPESELHRREDVRFFLERVAPLIDGSTVRWIGTVTGAAKLQRLSRAQALLAPVRWAEPGGTAIVEALACGTPVIGMRRGALGDLVEHGVTGWLADDEHELAGYLDRAGEIDPAACRRAAEERLSAETMAEAYLERYATLTSSSGRPGSRGAGAPRDP